MSAGGETQADQQTRDQDQRDGFAAHQADRPPSDEEREAADQAVDAESPEERARVREHYEEMAERGVNQKGEGRLS